MLREGRVGYHVPWARWLVDQELVALTTITIISAGGEVTSEFSWFAIALLGVDYFIDVGQQ